MFLKDESWRLSGEIGFYRYIYPFFGIGNDFEDYEGENYTARFPKIILQCLKKVGPNWFVGSNLYYENYRIIGVDDGAILDSDVEIIGRNGGNVFGLGIYSQYDTRDLIYYPQKGTFLEINIWGGNRLWGSDFNFTKAAFNYATYLSKNVKHIWAFNISTEFNFGDTPFHQLAFLGGSKILRGYTRGRFRDQNAIVFQAEHRTDLFWRLGAVAFAGVGGVGPNPIKDPIQNLRYTLGAGLRFQLIPRDRIHLRIDYGIGKNTSGFYLTVGEAF